MRLGSWPCVLAEGSFAHRAYGTREISERHRHRYEFNREYEERLKAAGLRITGETPDGTYVEICEIAGPSLVSSAASSIRSSSPSRWSRIRCSRRSSARRYEHRATPPAPASEAPLLPSRSTRVPIEFAALSAAAAPLVLIAGPCVIESEEHVHFMAREHPRSRRARSSSKPPSTRPTAPACDAYRGPGPAGRPAHPGGREGRGLFRSSPTSTSRRRPSRRPRWRTSCRSPRSSAARPICCSPPAAPAASSTSRRASSWRRTISTTPRRKWPPPATAQVVLTERGSSFGYNNLVVDMRGLKIMRDCRLAGGLRRHAQRAAAGRRGRGLRRPAAVHRAAGARGGGGGRRRRVRGSARRTRSRRSPTAPTPCGWTCWRDFWRKLRELHSLVAAWG